MVDQFDDKIATSACVVFFRHIGLMYCVGL